MEVLSNDQLYRKAPSIFAQAPANGLSQKYRFVPTIDVLNALRNEGFYPVAVAASRSKTDDGQDYVKHSIRLRRESDLGATLKRGGAVGQCIPELALTNSHNGSSGFILDAALHRLVCSNGLICTDSQGALRYRHTGKDDLTGQIIEGAYDIVEDFPKIADTVEAWSALQLDGYQSVAFARSALPLRFDADETTGLYPVTPEQLLSAKRYGDRRQDLFTVFNVVQENLIRGGIYTGRKNGRRQTTRKVSSVDRDLKLNRALWTLAEAMAGHVSGADVKEAA